MPELKNIQIERVEEMRLGKELDAKIADLLAGCFTADYEGRSYYQNRHHCRILMWHDDQLIGHAALGFRAVRQADRVFNVIGLAEVAVHPDFRGNNFAALMVEDALEEGRTANAEFALLFGVRRVYQATGFHKATNPVIFTPMVNTHSGQTETKLNSHLRVKPLADRQWDDQTPLDLSGFAF